MDESTSRIGDGTLSRPVTEMRMRVIGILSLLLLLYLVVLVSGVLPATGALLWTDGAWTLASLVAAVKCHKTARRQRQRHIRIAWEWFAGAAFLWFLGMLYWNYMELVAHQPVPYPAFSDVFFLAFAACFAVGTVYFRAQAPTKPLTLIQIGNLGLIFCTIAIAMLVILADSVRAADESTLYVATALGHAVAHLSAFFFALVCFWFYIWRAHRAVFGLLVCAVGLHGVADTLYSMELLNNTFSATSSINVLWLAAFGVQIWAAYEQDAARFGETAPDAEGSPAPTQYEAMIPPACLLLIIAALTYGPDPLTAQTVGLAGILAVGFVGFLGLREWWMARLEGQMLAAIRDHQRSLEKRVAARTGELSAAYREMESFSYSVSHDLRAPLRAINGFSQALSEDYAGKLDDEAQDYLARIRAASRRMGELIDGLLELSRIGKGEFISAPVDLTALAGEVIDEYRSREPAREITVRIDPGLATRGDRKLLRALLDNLISNAWKYTQDSADPRITIGAVNREGEYLFYVHDNGAGFDMVGAERLFRPFERLHDGDDVEGTGIGLATAQRVVQRHGGRIWAESESGSGATFYFTLPGYPGRHTGTG